MHRSTAELPSALEQFAALQRRLAGRQVAIFCDYDGTLAPIVGSPELARLDPATRAVLERLADQCVVAIISGRDLTDVMTMVATDKLWYAGSHGFDLSGPGGMRDERDEGLLSTSAGSRAASSTRSTRVTTLICSLRLIVSSLSSR
jgi:alpha,alpha-trehalase